MVCLDLPRKELTRFILISRLVTRRGYHHPHLVPSNAPTYYPLRPICSYHPLYSLIPARWRTLILQSQYKQISVDSGQKVHSRSDHSLLPLPQNPDPSTILRWSWESVHPNSDAASTWTTLGVWDDVPPRQLFGERTWRESLGRTLCYDSSMIMNLILLTLH